MHSRCCKVREYCFDIGHTLQIVFVVTYSFSLCLELGCLFGQTSHSSERGFSLKLLLMDVVDAEGLDSELVGEDGTCGQGR